MKKCVFCRFPANFRKMGEFTASNERSKAKNVSASGGRGASPPWPPTRGSAPGLRWGLPPDPRYRLALCALAMAPLCQILNTPLHTGSPVHTDKAIPSQWLTMWPAHITYPTILTTPVKHKAQTEYENNFSRDGIDLNLNLANLNLALCRHIPPMTMRVQCIYTVRCFIKRDPFLFFL